MGTRTVSQTINLQDPGISVSKYITEITGAGIKVAAANPSTSSNYIQITGDAVDIVADNTHKMTINANGMDIYTGNITDSIASFKSEGIRVGQITNNYLTITGAAISGYTPDYRFLYFDSNGAEENIYVKIEKNDEFILAANETETQGLGSKKVGRGTPVDIVILINDVTDTFRYIAGSSSHNSFTVNNVKITCTSSNTSTGCVRVVITYENLDTINSASIKASIIYRNRETVRVPNFSLGNNYIGKRTAFSTAIGDNLTIYDDRQLVIGKYNDGDLSMGQAFVIGNGSINSNSNAFTVDWYGNVYMAIQNYQTTGDVDQEIYSSLQRLGWSDVLI